MSKIIFLDIDGVLIPSTFSMYMEKLNFLSKNTIASGDLFGGFFAPHCTQNLKILIQKTKAKIVFTTNWKDEGFEKLKAMWKYRLDFGEPIGCTPTIENSIRGVEIDLWLSINEWSKFVIIDDMLAIHFHEHHLSHLVVCDEKFGFTELELKKAVDILE